LIVIQPLCVAIKGMWEGNLLKHGFTHKCLTGAVPTLNCYAVGNICMPSANDF